MKKGVLIVNKVEDMTSHDVVAIVRKSLGIKRVGHTGTLDPMARGVLPICVGNATRISEYIMEQGKTYVAGMKFGTATETYDSTGDVTFTSQNKIFTREEVESALAFFKGSIWQKPPMYSAIKINGNKLYDLARAGKDVDVPARQVKVYDIKLLELEGDFARIEIHCSKGTYVRSLINDLAIKLNSFAHMTDLVRTRVGKFDISDSISIDEIKQSKADYIFSRLIDTDKCLYNLDSIFIENNIINRLVSGQSINLNNFEHTYVKAQGVSGLSHVKVYSANIFIGLAVLNDNIVKMERVLYSD